MPRLPLPRLRGRTPYEIVTALRNYRRQSQTAIISWTVVLMGLVVLQGVTAVTSVLVARRVAPVEYGQYLSSLGLASLLIIIPNFGMDTLLLARGGLTAESLAQLWLRLLRLRIILLGAWLTVMALLGLVLSPQTYPFWVLWPTSLALAFESLVLLCHSALRSLGRHGWVTLLQTGVTIALLAITVGLRLQPGQIALFGLSRAAIWAIVTPLTLVATWHLLRRPTTFMTAAEPPSGPPPTAYLLSDFAAAIYTRAPTTIVALYLGAAGVAAFGPAVNLIVFTFIVPTALYFVVLPLLARLHRERPGAYRRVGLVQLALQGLAGSVISFVTVLAGGLIITRLFGANYAAAAVILVLLSPLPVLKALNFGLAAVLTASGRQTYRAITQVICAAFSIVGSVWLAQSLGLFGVVLVFVASEMVLLLGYGLGAVWPRTAAAPPAALQSGEQ